MTMLVLLAALAVPQPNAYDALFGRAADAYGRGEYAEASRLFEQLIAEDVGHPAVHYNLGNCRARQGHWAAAAAEYARALHLDPDMTPAAENLRLCQSRMPGNLPPPAPPAWQDALLFWDDALAPGTVRALAFVSWLALWVVATLRLWMRTPRFGYGIALLAFISAFMGASAWVKTSPPPRAIAAEDHAPVYYGAMAGEERFDLRLGDWVSVEDRRGEWRRIRTAANERGWVRQDALIEIISD
jgi:tetratricopeptide (TPR) repeat protein